jgi:hypothetical protein
MKGAVQFVTSKTDLVTWHLVAFATARTLDEPPLVAESSGGVCRIAF